MISVDVVSELEKTTGGSNAVWNHPSVTRPNGVIVTATHGTSSTDHITGVQYGGLALTRIITAADTTGEPGRADIWFLGGGGTAIPSGTQQVAALYLNVTDQQHFTCITLYTDDGSAIACIDSDKLEGDVANPSRTLQYAGRESISIAALYGGGSAPTAFTPNANCTVVHDMDFGQFYSRVIRQTTPGTTDFIIGGTAVIDDVAFVAAAFAKGGPTGYSLDCAPGDYTVTGIAATTARSRFIDSAPSSYALAGVATTLAKDFPIVASPGAYAATGAAATFARSYAFTAAAGTYSVTGTAATTARGYFVTAAPGSYTTAGLDTALSRGNFISALPGAYAATGQAATTVRGRFIDATPGAYSSAGIAATTARSYFIIASPQAYSVTGSVAELSKTTAVEHVLAADSGAHSITGAVTALAPGHFITADPGSYTTAGYDATFAKTGVNQYEIAADSGSYAVDGLTAALVFVQVGQFILTAAPGFYDLAASASELLAARQLILLPGSYAAAGFDMGGGIELYLLAQPGSYVLTGEEAIFELVRRFEPGIYLLSGTAAQLLFAPLQTVGDGWRFTDEFLASPVLAANAISNPVFSNEAFRFVAMDGESIRQTGIQSEALQTIKLEVPLQTVGKFTDESLVSPDLVGSQPLTPIFGSEGFSFPDLDDESTRQPGADGETLETAELEEEVLT
jgi:hypothetical protein